MKRSIAYITCIATAPLLASACTAVTPQAREPVSVPTSVRQAANVEQALFQTSYRPRRGTPGGTIVVGFKSAPANLNPFFDGSYASWLAARAAMRGLATISADGKFVPDLATRIPTVQNGGIKLGPGGAFTMTVTLKPGLKWSDGVPLTMNDLKYTWQWAISRNQVGCVICSAGYPDISAIDSSSDGRTAVIHWRHPYSGWLSWLTYFILPQHYMDKIPVASASTESMPMNSSISKVPFSGPFRYTNATSTETDAARNPYWYGGVSSAHPPYLQHLRFLWLGSQDGVIAAFKSGEIDLGLGASADQYWALASVPNSVGYADAAPNWYTEQLTLNNDPTHARGNGLWDPRVREALAMAINKPRLLKVLFPGLNIPPLCGPVATTFWYATIETGCPSYDPAKARQLLAAAGWKPDSKGWESRNGHEMNLLMCTTTGEPERLLTLEKVADYLQAVGIRTRISAVDDNSVLEASWTATSPSTQCSGARGTFDIIDYAPNIVGTPAVDLGGLYASGAWPSKAGHSGTNYAQFSDPLMDQAIFRLRSTVDPTQQLRYAAIAQNEYVKETASISLYDSTLVAGVGARLGNWAGYNPSDVTPTWNVEDWYVKS